MKRIVWSTLSVKRANMKEVNLGFIYQLGAQIHLLTEYNNKARYEIGTAIIGLDDDIKRLFKAYPALNVCQSSGEVLLLSIKEIEKWSNKVEKKKERINKADANIDAMFQVLINNAKEFETVLLADLEKLNVYYPQRKSIFDTRLLVSEAESAIPTNTLKKLNKQAILEINSFGKCLAFDNYTASGFHILRALEVVLHNYWVVVCKHKPEEHLESWSAYLSEIYNLCQNSKLSKKEMDDIKKLYYLLQQIKYQERNNIMHPEITLNEDDALSLFDTVKTAIKVMTEI